MEKRITQIGDIKSLQLPRKIERENAARIGPKDVPVPVLASRLPQTSKKRALGVEEERLKPFLTRPSPVDPTESSWKSVKRRVGSEPKILYHEWMTLDQAGPAIIGCDNTRAGNMVAIKRVERPEEYSGRCMPPFVSDYVVDVKDMYCEDNEITIIYEQMDVSLRQITGTLSGQLKAFEIAAICKEILNGLSYIHEELSLYCGKLNCGTVLLNRDGMIKIANIGESFLENRRLSKEKAHEDVKCVGAIMMELMEPTTSILKPGSIVLKDEGKWKDSLGIKDFLAATHRSSLKELKKHDFLPRESLGMCLKPHVFCTFVSTKTDWELFPPP